MSTTLFKTTVLGVGPYCVEFADGEIVTTRTEERQLLIASAPDLLASLRKLLEWQAETKFAVPLTWLEEARAAINKAEVKS